MCLRRSVAALFLVSALSSAAAAEDVPVDVELMLAVDVSRSMSPRELEIQRRGYAEALTDPEIMAVIDTGFYQKVALTYVEWSGTNAQRIIVDWTEIGSSEDLESFAAQLTAEFQDILRRTSISGVLSYAPLSFAANGFRGDRRVIDVSGDGPNNQGRPIEPVRDAIIEQGFVINGLPLMTRDGVGWQFHLDDLDLYYKECVIGGPLSFMIPVYSWEEFPLAVRRKILLELAGDVPANPPRVMPANFRGLTEEGYDCLIGEKMWQMFMQQYRWLED
ncbi:MAG: DUF1194 domain-containing protein [Pseudomonadota bacterium]